MKNSILACAMFLLFVQLLSTSCSKTDDGPSGPSKLLFIHGHLAGNLSTVLVQDSAILALTAGFGSFTGYNEINSGNQNFKIRDNITSLFVVNGNFNIASGKNYSLMTCGSVVSPELLIVEDDLTIADTTKAYIRLINLSSNSNPITMSISSGADLVTAVSYKSTSPFSALAAASQDLTIKAGSTLIATIANLNVKPNKKYSILVTGLVNQTPKVSYNIIVNK